MPKIIPFPDSHQFAEEQINTQRKKTTNAWNPRRNIVLLGCGQIHRKLVEIERDDPALKEIVRAFINGIYIGMK